MIALADAWDAAVNAACRWACRRWPSRCRTVPHSTDGTTPLLTQFMVWPGRCYLQHFETPEIEGRYHNHRWRRMRSFVLSGAFVEERPARDHTGNGCRPACSKWITHRRFTTYAMDRSVIHRTAWWSPHCWTLFVMSTEQAEGARAWGYYERRADGTLGPFIPWREGIARIVPSLETGKVRDA